MESKVFIDSANVCLLLKLCQVLTRLQVCNACLQKETICEICIKDVCKVDFGNTHFYMYGASNLIIVLMSLLSELPAELLEDSKFSPLNDDHPKFGPPVSNLIAILCASAFKRDESHIIAS